jgi:acyl carrier protein
MDNMMVERIKALLAQTFQVPIEEITTNLAFGDLPQWDSMGHMDVMMTLEEHFGVEINTDTIGELVSIPAICAYLAEKSHRG